VTGWEPSRPARIASSTMAVAFKARHGREGCVLKRLFLCSSGSAMTGEESMAARYVARFALLVSLTTGLAFQAVPASASTCHNTVVVTDGGDSAGATPGQLRTALVEVCSGGTIRLRPGLVVLLAQGELIIPSGKVVAIMSPRRQPATIDAQGLSRVFSVENTAQVTISSVIVQGGSASFAGGILNFGSLTLAGVTSVRGNQASSGGGIVNVDVVTMNGSSEVTDNDANTGGGILNSFQSIFPLPSEGLVTMNDNSRVSDNEADAGGGIWNDFAASFTMTVVLNDTSRIAGNAAPSSAGIGGRGSVTLNDQSSIASNEGVGISLVRATVVMNDQSSVRSNLGGGLELDLGGSVTLNDESTIIGNSGVGVGTLLVGVTLNGSSRISDNDGGGVWSTFGALTLNDNSTISGNSSQGNGGGVHNGSGTVVLNDNSRVVGNVASLGGGIYNASGMGPAFVTMNGVSKITGNTATGGQGGGVYSEPESTVTMNDGSSITGNIPDNCFPALC
jgi:hypothetical protein